MKRLLFTFCISIFTVSLIAQAGVSAGSLSYARDAARNNNNHSSSCRRTSDYHRRASMPEPETFIVEDFMNYHLHNITIPHEQDVALSIDYDNSLPGKSGEFIIQVGVATQPANLRNSKQNRVNVSIVVDVSGSMSGQKIESAREALRRFAHALNNGDYLSVILFDSEARVALPATCLTDNRDRLYAIIRNIRAGGNTNLNAGMMLGYKEASLYHSDKVNSRIILLTDGETNTGETRLDRIAGNSAIYNRKGIDISTIGVGQSLNFDLLRQLADKGKGSNYFIGEDSEDMYKVFDEELDALMYGIGKNANLSIGLPGGWEILKCYGYKPKSESANSISIGLNNLGASSTQIVMLKVKANHKAGGAVSARLRYYNKDKYEAVEKSVRYDPERTRTSNEVEKNFDIAFMAQNLKDAAQAGNQGNSYKMQSILNNTITWMKDSPYFHDADFKRVYDIVALYAPQKTEEYEQPCPEEYRY
jgi:Mg-chelatase subunit ChlD